MYYFTCIDTYSGVYQSQVIDVVKYLADLKKENVTLIAFIPVKNFFKQRKQIVNDYENSVVLPLFMGVSKWKYSAVFLRFFNKGKTIICRGPIAAKLALDRFDNVIYDGRAAVKAEVEEYDVVNGNSKLGKDFIQAEKEAVLKSKFRIAVSNKLVKYWRKEIGYNSNNHVVIPCSLSSKSNIQENNNERSAVRIVYAGGTSAWQSFSKVVILLRQVLKQQKNIEVLFLSKENDSISELIHEFPDRCFQKWVGHSEVSSELSSCDYGVLIRDNKVTNQVASPVKFAEYLNAGLQVLISENIGDFSEFVEQNKCGIIINDSIPKLEKKSNKEKLRIKELCEKSFMKTSPSIMDSYMKLLEFDFN